MWSSKKNKNNKVHNIHYEPGDIGNFLKQCRIDKKLTQLELGNILNVSPKTISKWENNNGFPDQLYQMPLCNALDITLEELHSGRLNIKQRNKEKKETRIKFALVFFIGLLLIVIVILFALLVYYKNFYNPLTLYYIDVTNDEQTVCNIDGYYIKDRSINMLYIGNLKLLIDGYTDTDLVEVNFIYNNEVIFYTTDTKNISINLDDDVNPNDITIEVTVKEVDNGKEKINKIFNIDINTLEVVEDNLKYNLNDKMFIKELVKMGFKKIDEKTYAKNTKDEYVTYDVMYQMILANTLGESKFTINYYLKTNDFNASLLSRVGNNTIMTEKFYYNFDNGFLKNDIGYAYSLNTVVKILEPYINLRNRYLVSTN